MSARPRLALVEPPDALAGLALRINAGHAAVERAAGEMAAQAHQVGRWLIEAKAPGGTRPLGTLAARELHRVDPHGAGLYGAGREPLPENAGARI